MNQSELARSLSVSLGYFRNLEVPMLKVESVAKVRLSEDFLVPVPDPSQRVSLEIESDSE